MHAAAAERWDVVVRTGSAELGGSGMAHDKLMRGLGWLTAGVMSTAAIAMFVAR